MQRKNLYFKCGLICLLIGLLLLPAGKAICGFWQQIELAGGGGVEDFCKVRLGTSAPYTDVVWTLSMGSGLYRSVWNGSGYGEWAEYIPGKGFLGVDAIYKSDTEYVLGGGSGVWYNYSNNGSFTSWDRPNGIQNYPSSWYNARVHDVSFWCESGSYASPPESKYIALLAANMASFNAGIYRWDNTYSVFDRVDDTSPTSTARAVTRIWRDMDSLNVLYVSGMNLPDTLQSNLFRLSGDYSSIDFDTLDLAKLADPNHQDSTLEFFSLNQWYENDTTYSYALVKYYDYIASQQRYAVFCALDLATIEPDEENQGNVSLVWDNITGMGEAPYDSWSAPLNVDGMVVGRPNLDSQGNHYLWVLDTNGAEFYDSSTQTKTQIVGSTSLTTTPTLKRWASHSAMPDFQDHITSNYNKMRLFDGTQHGGVFYLAFTNTSTYTWTQLVTGLNSTQMRSVSVFQSGGEPNVLVSTMNQGLRVFISSGWEFIGQGVPPNVPETDPTFQKAISQAVHWTANGDYDYWFNGGLYGTDHIGANAVTHGGLYAVKTNDNNNDVERIDFDPESNNSRKYLVTRIKSCAEESDQYLYVSTGIAGPENSSNDSVGNINIVCQYRNDVNWDWHRIYCSTAQNDSGLGILAVEPDPIDPDQIVYIGRGNFYDYANNNYYFARLDSIHLGAQALWDRDTLWQAPGSSDYYRTSVYDVTSIEDPNNSGKTLLFWGIGKMNAANNATAHWSQGDIYMRRWVNNTYEISPLLDFDAAPYNLGGISWVKCPAGMAVEAYAYNGKPYLVALVNGERTVTPTMLYPVQARVYLYDVDNHHWTDLGMPFHYLDSDIYPQIFDVCLDPTNGYDIYTTAYGRVLKLDRGAQFMPTSINVWHWISFNHQEAQDSLKYLFGDQSKIIEIKDQYHNSYKPNNNPPIDNIHTWKWLRSFAVKTSPADTLRVLGTQIPADTTIMLYPAPQDSSWFFNGLAYLPTDTLNVNEAFLADSDTVIIVKNDLGQFWSPGDGPDFDMYQGEGYSVGVNHTMSFQYPAAGTESITPPAGSKEQQQDVSSQTASHFQFTAYTGDFYAIYIDQLLVNGDPPAIGDEVGCFTPAGLCVGAGVYEGSFPIKIAAWKDDPTTETVDGYTPGELLSFKFYDVSAGVEVLLELQMTGIYSGTGQNYNRFEQGYYARHVLNGSYLIPGSYSLAQNFPNPFNPATTIKYDLPFDSRVTLEIFDVTGRKVITLMDGEQTAGFRSLRWEGKNANGAELSSGVYFCRLKAEATQEHLGKKDKFEKTLKMVLIK